MHDITIENVEDDLTKVLNERGSRYGSFKGHAEITQNLKRLVHESLANRDKILADDQLEALDMIVHKIGR
jgi:hypothetical protein